MLMPMFMPMLMTVLMCVSMIVVMSVMVVIKMIMFKRTAMSCFVIILTFHNLSKKRNLLYVYNAK